MISPHLTKLFVLFVCFLICGGMTLALLASMPSRPSTIHAIAFGLFAILTCTMLITFTVACLKAAP